MSRRDESSSPLAQIFACFALFGICIATLMRSEGHPMIVVVAGFGLVMSLVAILGSLFGRMRLVLARSSSGIAGAGFVRGFFLTLIAA